MAAIFSVIGLGCLFIASVIGNPFPAELIKVPNPEQNSVTATVTADNTNLPTATVTANKNNIQISGLSTGLDTAYPQDNATKFETTTETQKAPESYFSRIINDVMAIPIVVLRSVTKLITDAFSPKKTTTISAN